MNIKNMIVLVFCTSFIFYLFNLAVRLEIRLWVIYIAIYYIKLRFRDILYWVAK